MNEPGGGERAREVINQMEISESARDWVWGRRRASQGGSKSGAI